MKSPQQGFVLSILLLVVIGVLAVSVGTYVYVRQTQNAAHPSLTEETVSGDAVPPQPAVIDSVSVANPAKNNPEAAALIDTLLHTPVGRITSLQAEQAVESFRKLSGVDGELTKLFVSQDPVERLLGFYLSLETSGFTDQIKAAALKEPSVFVRAEVAVWLLRKMRFNEYSLYLNTTAETMPVAVLDEMFTALSESPAVLSVPVAMSRLNMGESLPRFLNELCARDPDVFAKAKREFGDPNNSRTKRTYLAEALAFVSPPDLKTILMGVIENKKNELIVRRMTAQHLSARFSDGWPDIKTYILRHTSMPNFPDMDITLRAEHLEELKKVEKSLREKNADSPERLHTLSLLLPYYLSRIDLLGRDAADPALLAGLHTELQQSGIRISTDWQVGVAYLAWRLGAAE